MSDRYPHLEDTKYPDLQNANVWAYQNNFDFKQFQDTHMHIKLISVPWDLGEVHVGLKIIPMGNVVGWNSKAERDTWLDAQQGIEWDTEYRSYHDDSTIKLPVPYEYMAYYNYIIVDYEKPPVAHTDGTGIKRFLYFIRDLKQLSLNSTQCTLQLDSWSMFINDVDISYMMMERGHYPMTMAASVEDYLAEPIKHTDYLLAPDVSYGTPSVNSEVGCINFEDEEVYYVIACTGNPSSDDWGTKDNDDWRIPSVARTRTEQDSPSYFIFAISPDDLSDFWTNVRTTVPQFACTVKAAYLISKSLCEVQSTFTFASIKCHTLRALNKRVDFGTVTKNLFDYGKYSDITKLYTSPYCYLEFTDGNGNNVKINVEDMGSDTPGAYRYLSIAYPYMSITAYLADVGNSNGEKSIKYQKLGQRNFSYNGRFWDGYWQLDIPTYAIVENNKNFFDYSTWYDRESFKIQALNSAKAGKDISDNNADASYTMTSNSADASVANTKTQNAANTVMTNYANTKVTSDYEAVRDYTLAESENDNTLTRRLANTQSQAAVQSATIGANAGYQTAQNSANAAKTTSYIDGAATVVSSTVGGFASGGQLGAAAGAITGVTNAIAGIATTGITADTTVTNASISSGAQVAAARVSANATETQAGYTTSRNDSAYMNQNTLNSLKAGYQKDYNTKNTSEQNSASLAISQKNASVAKDNASTQKTTTKDNNKTQYDTTKDNVSTQLSYQLKSSGLKQPIERGYFTGGDYQSVKPNALWCNVVTQPKDCIVQAGNEMLRYGYMWAGQVEFSTFNIMPKFSYWKVSDIWLTAKNLPDAWVDVVRNMLLHGVTVWAKPEYINNTSIFDN